MAQRASWGGKAQRCHCSPGCLPSSPGATVLLGLALQPLHSDDSHAHGCLFRGDLSDEAERAETGVILWKLLLQSWVLHSPNLALPAVAFGHEKQAREGRGLVHQFDNLLYNGLLCECEIAFPHDRKDMISK